MGKIGFKPQNVTRKIVGGLPERARDVLIKRYGLDDEGDVMTLEAIGDRYGITRERVRQIENHSITKLRKSGALDEHQGAFSELHQTISDMGGVVPEPALLESISSNPQVQNHVHFLLTVGEPFYKRKGTNDHKPVWYTDKALSEKVHAALSNLHEDLSDENLISEDEILNRFSTHLGDIGPNNTAEDQETLKRWLGISRAIGSNPLGEWGPTSSPNINLKGIRDYAYLVLRQNGSPMHFSEVTDKIKNIFGKKAHVATTHNELIRDERFVLVGRGLYALTEWGYMTGVVKDVIRNVLTEHGPLAKDEIIDRVLKERYVKPNTILVNLQDPKSFARDDEGRYSIIS